MDFFRVGMKIMNEKNNVEIDSGHLKNIQIKFFEKFNPTRFSENLNL